MDLALLEDEAGVLLSLPLLSPLSPVSSIISSEEVSSSTGAALTVRANLSFTPDDAFTVIIAVPFATAVTFPLESTVATFLPELE